MENEITAYTNAVLKTGLFKDKDILTEEDEKLLTMISVFDQPFEYEDHNDTYGLGDNSNVKFEVNGEVMFQGTYMDFIDKYFQDL